jgi:hypothetical protein
VLAVGAMLVLTDRRLYLLRQGAAFRPRTGILSWPIDRGLQVRIGPNRHGTRRFSIAREGRNTSLFVTEPSYAELHALATDIRMRTFESD